MNFDKYKNNIPYPRREDYKTIYVYSKGECVWEGSYYNFHLERQGKINEDEVKQSVVDEDAYKAARNAYYSGVKEEEETFRKDLMEEMGWDKLPVDKQEKIWKHVWDKGHSGGYHEVYNEALDLLDIV